MGARPYGVLGRVLGHSYTPEIYRRLAGLDYRRFEVEPDDVEGFIRGESWEGVNVTIPYKKVVAGLVDELTDRARRLGNVNTVTRLADGRLLGDNTDYLGFKTMLELLEIDVAGKRALVLGGRGGAGSTCMAVLGDLGCHPVAVGRTGEVTYADLDRYADASLVVNATPVGMYPDCPAAPCSLDAFPDLEAVADIVYNPARTALMMEAERRGVKVLGGLVMLVAQAAGAVERYTGDPFDIGHVLEVTAAIAARERSIALIGMPGSGKTRVGNELARLLGREHVDLDDEFERMWGRTCAAVIEELGEDAFRERETAVLGEIGKRSGIVISCGGGVVVRDGNYPLLHQNSDIVMLDRPIAELSTKGRPITRRDGVEALARERMGRYRAWADAVVSSRETPQLTARAVARTLGIGRDAVREEGDRT